MSNFLDDLLDERTANTWIQQGSEEWDKVRIGRFTSSEMWRLLTPPKTKEAKDAGKLSETALTYINVKVAETITGQQKTSSYAYPLVFGKEQEPIAIEEFCKKTGFSHEPVGFVAFNSHAGGSPDGIINGTDILEVKSPWAIETQLDYLMLTDQWDLKRLNPAYYWQCMSNLLFTMKEKCHFVSWDHRYPEDKRIVHLHIKPVAEDFDQIASAIEKAVKLKLELIKLLA